MVLSIGYVKCICYNTSMIDFKENRKKANENASMYKDDLSAGYVYCVYSPTFPEFIKVGKTVNLQKRLVQYNTSNPYSDFIFLSVSEFCLNSSEIETAIINVLGKNNSLVGREWFENTPENIDTVVAIIEAVKPINK